jgi:hypothetical protein
MGLRPTKWDENPAERRRRIFNRLRWAFDRAAAFQAALAALARIFAPHAGQPKAGRKASAYVTVRPRRSKIHTAAGWSKLSTWRWWICLIELRLSRGSVAGSLVSGRCGSLSAACSNSLRLILTMPPCLPSIHFSSPRISDRRCTTPLRPSMTSDRTSIVWHESHSAGSGAGSAYGGDAEAERVRCRACLRNRNGSG